MKLSWNEIKKGCKDLVKQLTKDDFKPDVIISISRGGTVIGTILSHLFKCEMAVVSAQRYKFQFGTVTRGYRSNKQIAFYRKFKPNEKLLLVDDVWDDGETICLTYSWIQQKLNRNEIRIATLLTKSKEPLYYYYKKVKKAIWIYYPWEKND